MPSLEERVLLDWIQELFRKQQVKAQTLATEPVRNRRKRLEALRAQILFKRDAIQRALYDDFKKPAVETDATEIFPVLDEIKLALDHLNRWTTPRKVDAPLTMLGTRSWITYEPRGVCLIMAPWNYPFNLCMGPLVSALAAGNCVMLKPSEVTTHTSALIKSICDAVFTDDVVAVCEGGTDVAKHLLQLPFDHIFFTGSPEIGKLVMRAAAENLSSVTLELGGKSPVIITPSARLSDAASRIAVAKFINNGQTCIAPDYVLVHASREKEFLSKLKEQVISMFSENGKVWGSPHYARIVNGRHFERLHALMADAIEHGASIEMTGEMDAQERFMHPVILTRVPRRSRIMEEEIFGPILPVLTYENLDDAIALIRQKPKPLALYLFGTDKDEQDKVLKSTSAGGVCINDCAIHFLHHNLPFGGVNTSGIGKSHGYSGFLAFSNEKPLLRQRRGITSVSFLFPPYTPRVRWFMNVLIRFFSR
jgi:aldehyde dehydrogenase (NAD+)